MPPTPTVHKVGSDKLKESRRHGEQDSPWTGKR